jgi:hypothetical protein
MALLAVPNPGGKCGKKIKSYIRGLEIFRIGLRNVMNQRSKC